MVRRADIGGGEGAGETPFDCAPFFHQGKHDKPALRAEKT